MPEKLLLGLIGAGIQRSLSPALQEEEGAPSRPAPALPAHRSRRRAGRAEALARADRSAARIMGFAGLNITYPCKQAVIPLLDALSDEAQAIGAVNTVVREGERLVGYNTDGAGLELGIPARAAARPICRAWCCSAPAARARPAPTPCCASARGQLVIVDQEPARAAALAATPERAVRGRARVQRPTCARALAGATGLIHATPTGMAKMPACRCPKRAAAAVACGSPRSSTCRSRPRCSKAARRADCARDRRRSHERRPGGVGAFKLFTGREADARRMDAHFRRLAHGAGAGPST